jgi:hypothetical protein
MMRQQTWGFVVDSDIQLGYEIYHHPRFIRNNPMKCDQFTAQQMKDPLLISWKLKKSPVSFGNLQQ